MSDLFTLALSLQAKATCHFHSCLEDVPTCLSQFSLFFDPLLHLGNHLEGWTPLPPRLQRASGGMALTHENMAVVEFYVVPVTVMEKGFWVARSSQITPTYITVWLTQWTVTDVLWFHLFWPSTNTMVPVYRLDGLSLHAVKHRPANQSNGAVSPILMSVWSLSKWWVLYL